MEKLKFESIESKSENNIYDKEKFSPEKAKEYVDDLTSKFKDFYSSIGYNEEPSVQISSGIDPTKIYRIAYKCFQTLFDRR